MTPSIPNPNSPTSNSDSVLNLNQLSDFRVDRLPIVSAFCHKIGIAESINAKINSMADIDAGTIVTAMILDTLSGRTPLYRFHEFFAEQDTELLLGHDIPAHRFTDDTLGRTLDRLHEAGTMKIFTEMSLKACRLFGVNTSQNRKAAYTVEFDSDELIGKAVKTLNGHLLVNRLQFQIKRGEQRAHAPVSTDDRPSWTGTDPPARVTSRQKAHSSAVVGAPQDEHGCNSTCSSSISSRKRSEARAR